MGIKRRKCHHKMSINEASFGEKMTEVKVV